MLMLLVLLELVVMLMLLMMMATLVVGWTPVWKCRLRSSSIASAFAVTPEIIKVIVVVAAFGAASTLDRQTAHLLQYIR